MGAIGTSTGIAALTRLGIGIRRSAVHDGHVVGGRGGAVLRPLGFAERTWIVRDAVEGAPRNGAIEALAARILSAATVRGGNGDRLILELVALALAGADETGLPFDETARRLEAVGWTPERVAATAAAEADRLGATVDAGRLGTAADGPPDGWTRFVFAEAEPHAADDAANDSADLDSLRTTWAGRLLARLSPPDQPGADVRGPSAGVEVAPGVTRALTNNRHAPATAGGPGQHGARSPDPVAPARGAGGSAPLPGQPSLAGRVATSPEGRPFAFRMQLRPTTATPGAGRSAAGRMPAWADARVATPSSGADQATWTEPAPAATGTGEPAVGEGTARADPVGSMPSAGQARPPGAMADRTSLHRATWNAAPTIASPRSTAAERPVRFPDPAELADQLAILLDDEADLRGIDR